MDSIGHFVTGLLFEVKLTTLEMNKNLVGKLSAEKVIDTLTILTLRNKIDCDNTTTYTTIISCPLRTFK